MGFIGHLAYIAVLQTEHHYVNITCFNNSAQLHWIEQVTDTAWIQLPCVPNNFCQNN